MRRTVALLAIAVLTGLALFAAPDLSEAAPRDPDELDAEARLAARYSPILYLQRIDDACLSNGDDFGPIPVDAVLNNSQIRLEGPTGTIGGVKPADMFLKGPEYYMDYPGQPTNPGCRYKRDFASWERDFPPVTYARVDGEPGTNGIVLQYWFFYYFNDWNNKHEGDWEMVQLYFRANSAQAALRQDPDLLVYTQHNGGETAHWDSGKLQREDTHPVVYVARGSHGNYYRPHSYLGLGENGAGLGCDVASGPRYRVQPKVVLLPHEPLPKSDPFAWITYFGKWGQSTGGTSSGLTDLIQRFPVLGPFVQREGSEFDGPPGPNATIRWPQPITWQERQRASSAVIPGAGVFNQGALQSFCGVITFTGHALSTYERWPEIALAVFVASLAFLGTVAFIMVRRVVRRGPIEVQARGLHRPRTLSQVLVASGLLYVRRLRLFLAIGALSIPFGLFASGVSDLMLSLPPLSAISGLYGDSQEIRGFIALQLGLLQLRLLYLLIVSVVAVTVVETDAGHEVNVRRAYGIAFRLLPAVVLARLRALSMILLLSLTVVGLPLAFYVSVRWSFVEQAVIFDGVHGTAALRRSSALVGGSAWRVALLTLLVAVLLTVSVPLLAAIFLFASPLSLEAINVIAGVFFAALIPYVALCDTLFYFDLVARHRSAGTPLTVR